MILVTSAWLSVGLSSAKADFLTGSWTATDVQGPLSPPSYGLRLDGFFGGTDPVLFHFQNVTFNAFADGTANLQGLITIAAYDNPGLPGTNVGDQWELNVWFEATGAGNPAFANYVIDTNLNGPELTDLSSPGDTALLRTTTSDNTPSTFQVGVGADGVLGAFDYSNIFGAAGSVDFLHSLGDEDHGQWTNTGVDEFAMLLNNGGINPTPEPGTLTLGLLGVLGLGLFGWRRRCFRGLHAQ